MTTTKHWWNEQVVSKREIACEYLDTAIEFYLARTNLFCAIHLAGAAEELLGRHLPEDRRISTLAQKAEKALKSKPGTTISDADAIRSVNEWKNQIKHMDNSDDATVTVDPMAAAEFHIRLALTNFNNLSLPETPAIRKFEDHQSRRLRALLEPRSSG
jgi:hypothetical protein